MRATSILRSAAVLTAAMLGGSCNSDDPAGGGPSGGVTPGAKKLTVVVAVVDSLMPDEITEATPNLKALKDGGTFYAESRSIFNAETIPNHVAMMTGVNPDRSGIVANSFVKRGQVIAPSTRDPDPLDRLPEQSETIDVAPTVAWLLGLNIRPQDFPDYPAKSQGFDGRVLKEAFTQFDADAGAPAPTVCGRFD
jgi:hypothetical protein